MVRMWCWFRCIKKVFPGEPVRVAFIVCLSGLAVSTYAQASDVSPDAAPVAIVGGVAIYEKDLLPLISAQLRQLRNQEYEVQSKALEQIITEKLLEVEAKKQGLTVEQLLQQHVKELVGVPSDSEVEAFYLGQKDRLGRPLPEVRPQLREALRQIRMQQAREKYVAGLREQAAVTVSLNPPRVQVGYDSKQARGNPEAPVTIVEFSDFHCPFCKRVQPTLTQLLDRYPDKVKLVFRDLPLGQLHPQARRAAEAARCARDQGKFWEYHDMLFEQAPKAAEDDLKRYAEQIGLDVGKFEGCLFQSLHHDAVQRDIDEATKLGMTGTPAFFINGRFLDGAQPLEKFVQIIDEELVRAASGAQVSARIK
jgi:protein-disulfide isomerase